MRQLYSALIIVIFLAVQFAVVPVSIIMAAVNPSITEDQLLDQILPYQAIAFAIGVIAVIIIGQLHKNKNRIERGRQVDIPVTLAWIVGGVVLAYATQVIAGLVNVYVLGNPMESENTAGIIDMIQSAPFMILVVALLGPILEEYVFRRAIFGEIYEVVPGSKVVAFLVAGLVSGLIFAVAHWDFTHILIYVVMAYTFSFLYVITGRLLVPIMVHMLMNGLVVLLQLMFQDYIEQMEDIQNGLGVIIRLLM